MYHSYWDWLGRHYEGTSKRARFSQGGYWQKDTFQVLCLYAMFTEPHSYL